MVCYSWLYVCMGEWTQLSAGSYTKRQHTKMDTVGLNCMAKADRQTDGQTYGTVATVSHAT